MKSPCLGISAFAVFASILFPQTVSSQVMAPPPSRQAVIAELVTANHILSNEGVIDAYGHVSVRDPSNPNFFFLSRNVAPGSVAATDVLPYDLDGNAIAAGNAASYSERYIHSEVYRARPDVMAIVHTHSQEIIPFSVTGVPLQPIFHMAAFLGAGIPVFEPRDAGSSGDLSVRSPQTGKALAGVLANKPGLLMRGHGAVLVGNNLHIAVARAYYLNANARLQQQAIQLGSGKVRYLDPDETVRASPADNYERAWAWWKDRLNGK
jgi:ribulose-5-phosphate 4-epimerase/fuculose-1-phosphate aldolase